MERVPSIAARTSGRPTAIIDFLRSVAPLCQINEFRLVPTAANLQPSAILHLPDETGRYVPSGVLNLEIAGNRIQRMTAFRMPSAFFNRLDFTGLVHRSD